MAKCSIARGLWVLLGLCLTACASFSRVDEPLLPASQPQKALPDTVHVRFARDRTSWPAAVPSCSVWQADVRSTKDGASPSERLPPMTVALSPGDVVNVLVLEGEEFNGNYTVGVDGRINLPFVRPVWARGLTPWELQQRIQRALARADLFQDGQIRASVRLVHYAAINVRVRGAVFRPGLHLLNEPRGDRDQETVAVAAGKTFGSPTHRRTLTAALRVAAGVRPDADLRNVQLVRGGRIYTIDVTGALTGEPLADPVLQDGDEIRVGSRTCFQHELVRPSLITPRGIRIYVSKIHFGADSRYDEKIPYGLRLLQAAIMASCIGGPLPTRGHREIVLVSTNPMTGSTEVVQRSVETLLRDQHRDEINPYLMPDDGVACYDAPLAEASDMSLILNSILGPIKTYQVIKNPQTQ